MVFHSNPLHSPFHQPVSELQPLQDHSLRSSRTARHLANYSNSGQTTFLLSHSPCMDKKDRR